VTEREGRSGPAEFRVEAEEIDLELALGYLEFLEGAPQMRSADHLPPGPV
jgi:hypothetical protein